MAFGCHPYSPTTSPNIVLWSIRSLIWYKSFPAILAILVAWVLTVVNMPKEGSESGGGGGGQRPPPGGREGFSGGSDGAGGDGGGSSSWWGGSGGKAKLKSEVPKGATGEVRA